MNTPHRTSLAVAVLALTSLGVSSAAQADPFVGRLIGSVAAGMLVNGAIKSHDKKFAAQCRLYDREGMEVYLPCDSRRPLGEVLTADKPGAMADGLAGGPPAAVDVAPLAAPPHAYAQRDDGAAAYAAPPPAYAPPVVHYAPPPVRYTPVEADCGCEHGIRDARGHAGRPIASFLSARGGHAQTSYGPGRVVGVHDAYEASSSSSAFYSESYGGGFYPYGAVGYGAGGYADHDLDRARVAGRDAAGFLTWPGKRVR